MPEKQPNMVQFELNPDGKTVNIISSDGSEWYAVPKEEAPDMVASGHWRPMTKEERKITWKIDREERIKEEYEDKTLEAAAHGFGSGITFGLADWAAEDYAKEHKRRLREGSPTASLAGEITSYLVPYSGVAKLGRVGAGAAKHIATRSATKHLAPAIKEATKAAKAARAEVQAAERLAGRSPWRQGQAFKQLDDVGEGLSRRVIDANVKEAQAGQIVKNLMQSRDTIAAKAIADSKWAQRGMKYAHAAGEGFAMGVAAESSRQALYEGELDLGKLAKSAALGAGLNTAFTAGLSGIGWALRKANLSKSGILNKAGVTEGHLAETLQNSKTYSAMYDDIAKSVSKADEATQNAWVELSQGMPSQIDDITYKRIKQYAFDRAAVDAGHATDDIMRRVNALDPQERISMDVILDTSKAIRDSIDSVAEPWHTIHQKMYYDKAVTEMYGRIQQALPFASTFGKDRLLYSAGLGLGGYAATEDPTTAALLAITPFAVSRGVGMLSKTVEQQITSGAAKGVGLGLLRTGKRLLHAKALMKAARVSATSSTINMLSQRDYKEIKEGFDLVRPADWANAKKQVLLNNGVAPQSAQKVASVQEKLLTLLKTNVGDRVAFSKLWNAAEDSRRILARILKKELTKEDVAVLKIQMGKYFKEISNMAREILAKEKYNLDFKSRKMLELLAESDNKTLLYQKIGHSKQAPEGPKSKKKMRGAEATTTPLQSASKNLGG